VDFFFVILKLQKLSFSLNACMSLEMFFVNSSLRDEINFFKFFYKFSDLFELKQVFVFSQNFYSKAKKSGFKRNDSKVHII
jgi:hypothetical protein